MTIIELNRREDGGHGLQSQSDRTECWMDGWIAVPPELEESVWNCMGFCDLTIEDGVLTGITPIERPEPGPEPTPAPTQLDRIEAQITYTAMMTDTLIPEVTV